MRCQTKEDFDALSTLLSDLVISKHGNHPLYAMFVNKLVVDLAAPLKDIECRKAASGLTTLSNTKQAEAKAGKGKGKKAGKPALGASKTVGGGRADTSTYEEAMDDGDYDDFVSGRIASLEGGDVAFGVEMCTDHLGLRACDGRSTYRCRYPSLVVPLAMLLFGSRLPWFAELLLSNATEHFEGECRRGLFLRACLAQPGKGGIAQRLLERSAIGTKATECTLPQFCVLQGYSPTCFVHSIACATYRLAKSCRHPTPPTSVPVPAAVPARRHSTPDPCHETRPTLQLPRREEQSESRRARGGHTDGMPTEPGVGRAGETGVCHSRPAAG